jgi:hypothetical protein
MSKKIKITDFLFAFSGYGHYRVTYTSPCTGKEWSRTINDMETIDATKNREQPKIKDLNLLKTICKGL